MNSILFGDSWLCDTDQFPPWDEASTPNPTIQNNSFMGQRAFDLWQLSGQVYPISIGSNYYGDRAGYYDGNENGDWGASNLGFLGHYAGYVGAYLHGSSNDSD